LIGAALLAAIILAYLLFTAFGGNRPKQDIFR
jgi:hypothetical protein